MLATDCPPCAPPANSAFHPPLPINSTRGAGLRPSLRCGKLPQRQNAKAKIHVHVPKTLTGDTQARCAVHATKRKEISGRQSEDDSPIQRLQLCTSKTKENLKERPRARPGRFMYVQGNHPERPRL